MYATSVWSTRNTITGKKMPASTTISWIENYIHSLKYISTSISAKNNSAKTHIFWWWNSDYPIPLPLISRQKVIVSDRLTLVQPTSSLSSKAPLELRADLAKSDIYVGLRWTFWAITFWPSECYPYPRALLFDQVVALGAHLNSS